MKILITTFGTRGDIQPFIALGKGLKAAGYDVAICTSAGFKSFVEEHDVHYVFMDNELLRLSQAALGETGGIGDTLSIIRNMVPAIRRSMDDEWHAALTFQPDLILYHPKCLGSYHVAEKLQIPAMISLPLPFYTPTREFPIPFFSNIQLGGWFNHFSYRFMGVSSAMYGGTINDFRVKTVGLRPLGRFPDLLARSDGSPIPILYPYSEQHQSYRRTSLWLTLFPMIGSSHGLRPSSITAAPAQPPPECAPANRRSFARSWPTNLSGEN